MRWLRGTVWPVFSEADAMKLACAGSLVVLFVLLRGVYAAERRLPIRRARRRWNAWLGPVRRSPGRPPRQVGRDPRVCDQSSARQRLADTIPGRIEARPSQNKPVVILAINADKKTDIGLAYMNARDFNGPNILHGRDPLLPARLGLESDFFNYVLIDPTGTLVESGDASRHFTDGAGTRYALPGKFPGPRISANSRSSTSKCRPRSSGCSGLLNSADCLRQRISRSCEWGSTRTGRG